MKIVVVVLMVCFNFFGWTQTDDLKRLKIVADGMAVNFTMYSLTVDGNNPKAEQFEKRLQDLLDDLGKQNTGFRKDSYPIELNVNAENNEAVNTICGKIEALLEELRAFVKIAEAQFPPEDYSIITTLLSENPGDYYNAINPNFEYVLSNHPFNQIVEEIQLQDIGFSEIMADGDSSLWAMGIHCPKLKSLILFGAEIDSETLDKMNLNAIKKLEILQLSENDITQLPADFNVSNSLLYLDLKRNELTHLPENLAQWNKLNYLNLSDNLIENEEKERIKKALPQTEIIF